MKFKVMEVIGETVFDVKGSPKTLSEKLTADRERINKSRKREISSTTGWVSRRIYVAKINPVTGEASFPKRNLDTGEFE
jgi:hypothetical protein